MSATHIPVLIGVGQVVDHWNGSSVVDAPSPVDLMAKSVRRAYRDAGLDVMDPDILAVVRTFADSLPQLADPFGNPDNLAASVAQAVELSPKTLIYSTIGGEQPQALVNEMCERIGSGTAQLAVVTGGEAIAAMKLATRSGLTLDWSSSASVPQDCTMDDRGLGQPLASSYELKNGLGMPPQTYGVLEDALRARLGLSVEAYRAHMADILVGLSETAARNPYAQFPRARAAEFLGKPSSANYPVAGPHLKWHIAQDAVNQGAAILIASQARARELGVDPAKWIYLHGYSEIAEKRVSERQDLSHSPAIGAALRGALESAGIPAETIAHHDIYSCFPIVLHLAAEVLGLDPARDQMTVTGGLPFFGGPGNNYSTHAITTMVEMLRADPQAYGLVLANGGFMSKQAVGVYSAQPRTDWVSVSSRALQASVDAQTAPTLLDESGIARIEAVSISHGRNGPSHGFVLARTERGRIMATIPQAKTDLLETLAGNSMHGRNVRIEHVKGRNILTELLPKTG